jgi:branched-chain amino acid aminotransferase
MPEKVFLNDKLTDADKACISVRDSGFLYGAGLFETMRSHNGVVFALTDHLDRLFFSARKLSINSPYDKKYVTDAVYQVLRANKLSDARLRLTLTNGPMADSDRNRKPTLLVTATKFRSYPPEYYKNGVMVILCPFRQNRDDPTCGHKTANYYSRMIALNMAHQKRAAEALWFTTDHRLAEGCVSNVFLVKSSMLLTPPIETPVLAGVARKTIFRLGASNSIELLERDLNVDDLLGADEIFLTNVIMQVMPITKVEKHTVGDGKVGPMAKKLQRSFAEYVENECQTGGNSD